MTFSSNMETFAAIRAAESEIHFFMSHLIHKHPSFHLLYYFFPLPGKNAEFSSKGALPCLTNCLCHQA